MPYLVITRHSHRDDTDNPEKYTGTRNNDCPISDRGVGYAIEQAGAVSQFLKDRDATIETIYHSPFLRTRQTAEIYSHQLGGTRQMVAELAEGQDHFKPCYGEELMKMLEEAKIEYPESDESLYGRCRRMIDRFITDGVNTVMITHGIIVNILLQTVVPEHRFDRSLTAGEYIPRCCDNIILSYDAGSGWTLLSAPKEILDGLAS